MFILVLLSPTGRFIPMKLLTNISFLLALPLINTRHHYAQFMHSRDSCKKFQPSSNPPHPAAVPMAQSWTHLKVVHSTWYFLVPSNVEVALPLPEEEEEALVMHLVISQK
jgi:hypothetical protein